MHVSIQKASETIGKFQPDAAEPGAPVAKSLAQEFRRWMIDEIEEISELIVTDSDKPIEPVVAAKIVDLADLLTDQADILGHDGIRDIAVQLKQCVESGRPVSDCNAVLHSQVLRLRTTHCSI